ncbi:hypothetical protein BDZ97DRAFT_1819484 [Flammula alnicola]|nr:hypothetical protein BDZ97DRAFT_1819484 [Flammula alnicola]
MCILVEESLWPLLFWHVLVMAAVSGLLLFAFSVKASSSWCTSLLACPGLYGYELTCPPLFISLTFYSQTGSPSFVWLVDIRHAWWRKGVENIVVGISCFRSIPRLPLVT